MSKPSRLARPVSANTAPKSPLSRKEDFNSRSRKIRLGEKILRAGSEGNLVKQHQQEQVEITEGLVPRRAPFLKGNWLFHAAKKKKKFKCICNHCAFNKPQTSIIV